MPLTHVAKGLLARDIIRDRRIEPSECEVFDRALAYFFYGRPAYRVSGDGAIRDAATCPFCFIFDPSIIDRAQAIHAFDTGAFDRRMYNHVLMEEMQVGDFSLERDTRRPNRLIRCVFGDRETYFEGDTSKIPTPDEITEQGDFLARAYIKLLRSEGRNEVDDRICTIEVTFGDPVLLDGALLAVVVPDILWNDKQKTVWLADLDASGVEVLPFRFSVGREPAYHQALIEQEVRAYYAKNQYL
jgi:hypothetical protein